MKKCKRCNGNGWIYKDQGLLEVIFTAFVAGSDMRDCPACGGVGFTQNNREVTNI